MGKSKKNGNAALDVPNDTMDSVSVNSDETENISHISLASENLSTTNEDTMSEELEKLTEKRPTTREHALEVLRKGLISYRYEWTVQNHVTLGSYLKRSVQKGEPKEAILALNVMELASITLGKESSEYLPEWSELLTKITTDTKNSAHKEEALWFFGLLCVLCDEEGEITQKCFEICNSILQNPSQATGFVVQAAHVWAWILCCFPISRVVAIYESSILMFSALLQSNIEVDIRVASGENIALLVDIFADCPDKRPSHPFDLIPELSSHVENVHKESTKSKSKKDKLKQRTAFRSILETLVDGESPAERVVVRSRAIDFRSWKQLCKLHYLKKSLGSGFQTHFFENDVVGQVLDVAVPRDNKALSRDEKRQQHTQSTAATKERHNLRTKQRRQKNQHQPHGEDSD